MNHNENFWCPRPGKSDLRKLEQFFVQVLKRNSDVFEVVSIYTGLRNDQFKTLEDLLQKWGPEVSWFVRECKVDNTMLGMRIVRQNKINLEAKFKIK